MKKLLIAGILLFLLTHKTFAQTRTLGPVEQKFTESLCTEIGKIDQSKITDSKEAMDAFMKCFMAQSDKFVDLATEKHVDMTDQQAMHNLGVEIGKDLLNEKCAGFMQLAVKMAEKKSTDSQTASGVTVGTFKRIDNKGFNYIIIVDNSGSEKSFLWLRPFPNSDRFTSEAAKYSDKKFQITWQEIEVYLPQAKGYYNLKEITGIEVL